MEAPIQEGLLVCPARGAGGTGAAQTPSSGVEVQVGTTTPENDIRTDTGGGSGSNDSYH